MIYIKTMIKVLILLTFLLFVRHSASNIFAAEVTVENNVSVEASTGGNSAKPGETINGWSSADVQIKTIVNGEVVEDTKIHEESTGTLASPMGGPIIIKKEFKSATSTASTTIKAKVKLNSIEKSDKKYENIFKQFFKRFFGRFRFW